MRLNHLDLHVHDVAATRDFFLHYFGFEHVETKGIHGLAILRDSAGLELVISRPAEKYGGADQVTLGVNTYHIGFILPKKEDVDALYLRMKAAQAEIRHEPREVRQGWLFYCMAPGHVLVEVGWRP
jgi:extradiol dioxygenase family protein